jgi:hypothetical protein
LNPVDLELADVNLAHNIDLMRFSAGEQKKVRALLTDMQKELVAKLQKDLTDFSRARVEKLLKDATGIIEKTYKEIAPVAVPTPQPTITEIQSKIFEIIDSDTIEDVAYGLRVIPSDSKPLKIGSKLQSSFKWVDNERSNTRLPGTSVIEIKKSISDKQTELEIENAVKSLISHGYSGDTVALVRGDFVKKGVDPGEAILRKSEVMQLFSKDELQGNTEKATNLYDLAKHEADFQAQSLAKVGLEASLPSEFALKALVNGSVIEGAPSGAWWAKQAQDTAFKFAQQVRQGIAQGETLQQIIIRVAGSKRLGTAGIMEVSRRNASALVHTSIMQVAGDAREAFIKANEDVYKGYRWLSTLDGHVCPKCIPRSGAMWDLNHNPIEGNSIPYHTTPLHFSCRCVILGITKSYRDLGLNVDEMKPGTRASDLGQVPADMSFEGFLGRHNKEYADDLLGKGRADLWRKGKITLSDLLDSNGRELSFSQLKAKL